MSSSMDLRLPSDDADVVIGDGRIVRLRDVTEQDEAALLTLHRDSSAESVYRRFFQADRAAADRYAHGLARANTASHCAIGAFSRDRLIGVGVYDRTGADEAEFALLVADDWQGAGVGTLLLEHLVAEARANGIRRFSGDVLATNTPMIEVVRDLGFEQTRDSDQGVDRVGFDLDVDALLVAAVNERERRAGAASLRPMLQPHSIAVIGAGRRAGTVGHEVLRSILRDGFTGPVYAVNPHASDLLGVPTVPDVASLPGPVDLAVIALPAPLVPDALRACGAAAIPAAVILGGGFGEADADGVALQHQVLAVARELGIRVLGPNCVGLLNTDPAVRLNGTFAQLPTHAGPLAVVSQSGAVGLATVHAAEHLGLGVAQFVSIGNKVDVGGNDVLLAWAADPRVGVVTGYFESVGDPRRFARIARSVAAGKPVVAIKAGRTDVGKRAGQSHTAAAASSDIAIDALFRAAGVLRVTGMQELVDAARVLAQQPLPAGPRVALVGNSGGPEILAADAASTAGLTVPEFDAHTAERLTALGVTPRNPLDLGALVDPDVVRDVLVVLGESPAADAIVTVFTDVAVNDGDVLRNRLCAAADSTGKTCLTVSVGGDAGTWRLATPGRALPVFTFPEPAMAALATAHRYGRIRATPIELPARPSGVDTAAARQIVRRALDTGRDWLDAAEAYELLAAYGLPLCRQITVEDVGMAVAAANRIGYPVAIKLGRAGLHKTELGGVHLDVKHAGELRDAVAALRLIDDGPLVIQPMITGGIELIVGSVRDPQCGPLVMIGMGGVITDVLGDRSFMLAPLTSRDAATMIDELRASALLDGYRGSPVVPRDAVADVLIRVAALVDDLPEIAELDLNPLIGTGDGVVVIDARVRVTARPASPDPLVRQLRHR